MGNSNKYIAVAYELYANDSEGVSELVEKAPIKYPFQFISGLGTTLDVFEENIVPLEKGDKFDFIIPMADAYGEHYSERIVSIDKKNFYVDGRFDKETIYEGNIIPLVNGDGDHFQGLILEVSDDTVVVDINLRLAGKDLHFVGEVVENRIATEDEVQGEIARMSGGGCGCGSCGDGCGDDCCSGHDHKGGCGGTCH